MAKETLIGSKVEVFSLHSKGEKNGVPFSSSSIPLSTLETIVHEVPNFVIGSSVEGAKKSDIKDAMSVSITDGSINVGVALPIAMATLLTASSFKNDLTALSQMRPNDVKDRVRLQSVKEIKDELLKEGAKMIGFASSLAAVNEFDIVAQDVAAPPQTTPWINSDTYVMAMVTDLGGKSKVNVHLEIEGRGTVVAESIKQYLSDLPENMLYKRVLAHVAYRVNTITGEWDNPRLISIENPAKKTFDMAAFEQSIADPSSWDSVMDPISEIRRLRGENV